MVFRKGRKKRAVMPLRSDCSQPDFRPCGHDENEAGKILFADCDRFRGLEHSAGLFGRGGRRLLDGCRKISGRLQLDCGGGFLRGNLCADDHAVPEKV